MDVSLAQIADIESIKALAPLGVGGALAGIIFFFYRRDFLRERNGGKGETDRLERREDRLLTVLERNATANEGLTKTIESLGVAIRGCPAQRWEDRR